MKEAVLSSADTAAKLIFSDLEDEYFTVTYDSPDLRVMRRCWGYTDSKLLVEIFEHMAAHWKGWEKDLNWSTVEGEFSLTATMDKRGHVMLDIVLIQQEERESWSAKARLKMESGQLDVAAKKVRGFFLG